MHPTAAAAAPPASEKEETILAALALGVTTRPANNPCAQDGSYLLTRDDGVDASTPGAAPRTSAAAPVQTRANSFRAQRFCRHVAESAVAARTCQGPCSRRAHQMHDGVPIP